jgi:hypothetical protein
MMFRLKLLILFPLILSFCHHASTSGIDPKALQVFRDFAFVGQGPAKVDSDGSLDVTYIAPHNEKHELRTGQLQTRVQYIFHNEGPANDEHLGLTELPNRLRLLGFKVLDAPKFNGGQFSYPYIGGPYFSITFTDGDHKGVIFNRVDGKIADKSWLVNDYILVFLS